MSEKNPKIVIDTIIDENSSKALNIGVYPITIRRYSWMEKINSPFLYPEVEFCVDTIIPTAYVLCTTKEKLREYKSDDKEKLIQDAFDWSEDLNLNDVPEMIKAITKQLNDMNKVSPDSVQQKSKKKEEEGK